jgi:hypothetical protein
VIGDRRTRVLASCLAAITAVAVLTLVAGAHDADLNDPNDTAGKLDVAQVRVAHEPGPPRWSVITFAEWTNLQMWDRGYVMIFLDTRGNAAAEYYLLVRSAGPTLEGTLWQLRSRGPDSYLGTVPVGRPTTRSVVVQVGLRRLAFGPTRRFYRWRVQTVLTSETCPRTCQDRAPNAGQVLQWRPGMSPTPSPSPSGSPSEAPAP